LLLGQQEITCEARRGSFISSDPSSCILLSVLHVELDIVFNSADGRGRHSTIPDTLLTITVSTNADSSLTTPVITSDSVTTELAAEGDTVRPSIQLNHKTRQPMAAAASLYLLYLRRLTFPLRAILL
jgi:hypothetical protein